MSSGEESESGHLRRVVIGSIGPLLMLAVAIALFSRFSIDDTLRRDESIYVYGGQQMAAGIPPYASIFDVKTPLAAILAAGPAAIARPVPVDQVHLIRLEFFAFSCATVVAVYLLALSLWASVLAGIVSAVTFASFTGFAIDALGGPDAKTPGILLAVVAMILLVRRRWFWGALAGSLAFIVWQPLAVYPVAAIIGALFVASPEGRWRRAGGALAGAMAPVAVITLYFALAGALHELIEATILFPIEGVRRGRETPVAHLDQIADTVSLGYGRTGEILFWTGLLVLVAVVVWRLVRGRSRLGEALKDPLVSVVMLTLVPLAVFSVRDFQNYPDLYPALPYAALGIGGAAALAVQALRRPMLRRAATALALVATVALVGSTWDRYSMHRARDTRLVRQAADAASIERLLGRSGTLYALGDPTPLVLTGRRNPSRFIYLGSGVARWKAHHTRGRMMGWKLGIAASRPSVVVIAGWTGARRMKIEKVLRRTYDAGFLGRWRVFLTPEMRARAASQGVPITGMQRPRA